MNARPRGYLITLLLFGVLVSSCPSNAQYTADYQTNIISGVTSNWTGNYAVGYPNSGDDALLIQNSGALSDGNGVVGVTRSNTVVVTGSGSVWNNVQSLSIGTAANTSSDNQMTINNG